MCRSASFYRFQFSKVREPMTAAPITASAPTNVPIPESIAPVAAQSIDVTQFIAFPPRAFPTAVLRRES
jgi:hypothetical protein